MGIRVVAVGVVGGGGEMFVGCSKGWRCSELKYWRNPNRVSWSVWSRSSCKSTIQPQGDTGDSYAK